MGSESADDRRGEEGRVEECEENRRGGKREDKRDKYLAGSLPQASVLEKGLAATLVMTSHPLLFATHWIMLVSNRQQVTSNKEGGRARSKTHLTNVEVPIDTWANAFSSIIDISVHISKKTHIFTGKKSRGGWWREERVKGHETKDTASTGHSPTGSFS